MASLNPGQSTFGLLDLLENNSVRSLNHCFWSFLLLMDHVILTVFSLSNELLEFLLLYFLHLSLIHLNLFLNMLKDMGPILYSSRWIASCASTIYQITLNRKAIFCFMLNFSIYQDLFLKFQSTSLINLFLFMPVSYRCDGFLECF